MSAFERLTRRGDKLLPPAHLRIFYYRTFDPEGFHRACRTVRTEVLSHGLQPHHRVLDVGSGIGNLALALTDYLTASYEGIEINREAAAWCQSAITPRYPAFRFQHVDLAGGAYNSTGFLDPSVYRFPFPDQDFDFVFLGSVFTHMLPEGVANYLREIGRMLRPGGMCVASYFLLNDRTRADVAAGTSFLRFPYEDASRRYRLQSVAQPEAAVALDESLVGNAYAAAGLAIRDVRRGGWSSGRRDDQDVVRSVKA